jgi:hypothetical protein
MAQSWSSSFILHVAVGKINCCSDVLSLGAFIATGKKNNQHSPSLLKIDSVTRTKIDPQLRYSSTYGAYIAWIAANEALNPGLDDRLGPQIPKAPEPTRKLIGTTECSHLPSVAPWLRQGKGYDAVLYAVPRSFERSSSPAREFHCEK